VGESKNKKFVNCGLEKDSLSLHKSVVNFSHWFNEKENEKNGFNDENFYTWEIWENHNESLGIWNNENVRKLFLLFPASILSLKVTHPLISKLKWTHILENKNKKYFHKVNETSFFRIYLAILYI
jgi:hypothetical protein